jgi:hypothetical protein
MADKPDARTKLGKLMKQCDELGIAYQEDATVEHLELLLGQVKEAADPVDPEVVAGVKSTADLSVISKAIAEGMSQAMKMAKREDGKATKEVSFNDYDPADVADPKTYFAPSSFWILPAAQFGSQQVHAPFGKIVFTFDHGSAVRFGDQYQTRYQSSYTSRSKKEQAYMEAHPYFGKYFFLSYVDADKTSTEVSFALKFASNINMLNAMQAPQLLKKAAEMGVKLSKDMALPKIRTMLAEQMTNQQIREEQEKEAALVRATGRLDLLSAQAQ